MVDSTEDGYTMVDPVGTPTAPTPVVDTRPLASTRDALIEAFAGVVVDPWDVYGLTVHDNVLDCPGVIALGDAVIEQLLFAGALGGIPSHWPI
jgi:hypothetical protein